MNLDNVQTAGLTKITAIKILREASEAKAAKTLICPTLETNIGVVCEPKK